MWYCFNFNILFIHQFFGSSFLISDQMTDHQNPESAYPKSIWLFLVHLLSAFIRRFHHFYRLCFPCPSGPKQILTWVYIPSTLFVQN